MGYANTSFLLSSQRGILMKWNLLLDYVSLCGIVVMFSWWFRDGQQIYTKDKREIVIKEVDPLFGTTVEKRDFVEDFQMGLLPGDDESIVNAFKSASVPSSLLCGTNCFLFLYDAKRKSPTKKGRNASCET
jgi:hypothetical protein